MTDHTLYISWTQLRVHAECRQKAALIRGGKRNPAQNLRSYFHGMVVDQIMRTWLRNPIPGAMPRMVDDAIHTTEQTAKDDGDGIVRWRGPDDRSELRTFCLELVTRLEPILNTHVLPHEFEPAKYFKVPVTIPYLDGTPTTVYLRGEMDLLVHPAAGPVVWDLKGTRDDTYWRKVIGQLIFYDLAVLALHRRPTQHVGLIQPMCTHPTLEFTITDDHRRQMWSRIISMAEDIWRNDTPCTTTTSSCTYCEVRHACPRFTPDANNTIGISAGLRQAAKETR